MIKRNDEFSLKELVTLFIPRLWLIIIIGMIVGTAFGGYSAFVKEKTYTSSVTIHIVKQSSSMSTGDLDVVSKVIEDYKILVGTEIFLEYVTDDIHASVDYVEEWNIDNGYIKSHMSTRGVTDDILEISVTTDKQKKSHLIASVVSDVIMAKSDELFAFDDSLTLKILNPSKENGANSKNVPRNIAVGFAGGALVTMLAIFLFAQFDVVVHDKRKLEDTFELPIIGIIPRYIVEEDKQNV